jgi:hypothetical protein
VVEILALRKFRRRLSRRSQTKAEAQRQATARADEA